MKFLSAASTATFSSLLLLAEAASLNSYFVCGQEILLSSEIHNCESVYFYSNAEADDPTGPNGEQFSAFRFTKKAYNGGWFPFL
ncbi:Bgt-51827 [Blumeria graminis f. sp. tritici]|uniref:Bgt-51827 n=1 Tax=Blumeria graminis f. sp. tritici TaxID=62690 RepID=A0A9X9MPM4_BLUGR|nr:Bgt-51827 [Blumeria graminis f. sp. tritici]